MFELVEMCKTKDGKLHANENTARLHVESVICDAFAKSLSQAANTTRADVIRLASTLYENREMIRAALEFETYGTDYDD